MSLDSHNENKQINEEIEKRGKRRKQVPIGKNLAQINPDTNQSVFQQTFCLYACVCVAKGRIKNACSIRSKTVSQ